MLELNDINSKIIELYNQGLSYTNIAGSINSIFNLNDDIGYTKGGIGYVIKQARRQKPQLITRAKNIQNANNAKNSSNKKYAKSTKNDLSKNNTETPLTSSVGVSNFKKTTLNNNEQRVVGVLDNLNEQSAKDETSVLKAFGYDPKKWKIRTNKANSYQMQGKGGEIKTFWQYNITVQPINGALSVEDIAEIANKVTPKYVLPVITHKSSNRNLVLSFADLHFGITKFKEIEPLLKDLLQILSLKKYSKIRIEQLGDLFHSDMFTSIQTASGTLLDTDGTALSMQSAVKDATLFYKTIITACLQNTSDVEVYHTQGNHSPSLEYMFLLILEQMYPTLKIHKNISSRSYYRLDNVGLMIAHGDNAKNKLPMLFATEAKDIWAKSNYREIHTGHYHFENVKDDLGVVFRQLGTPKPSDGYEKKNGYTMAHKKLQAFEYSPDDLKVIYNLGL